MNNSKLDILKKIGTGFNTPENYFKSVEDAVFVKLATEKFPVKEGFALPPNYLETIEAKVFQEISVKNLSNNSDNVPSGYFDTIEDRVFERIQVETEEKPKVIHLKSRFIKIAAPIAIAASLLLLILLNFNTKDYPIEDIAVSDLEEWIEDDLITLDSYEIAELYNDVNLEDEFSNDDLDVLNYVNGTDIESVLLTD